MARIKPRVRVDFSGRDLVEEREQAWLSRYEENANDSSIFQASWMCLLAFLEMQESREFSRLS